MFQKITLVLSLVFLFVIPLSAEQTKEKKQNIREINKMLVSRLFMQDTGRMQIMDLSENLALNTRLDLYRGNRKLKAMGWINLIVPSAGNWYMGDKVGGIVADIGFGVGFIGYLTGYTMMFSTVSSSRNTKVEFNQVLPGLLVMAGGVVIVIGSGIYSTVSALSYADKHNGNLKKSLSLTDDQIEGNYDDEEDEDEEEDETSYYPALPPLNTASEVGKDNNISFRLNLVSIRF